MVALRFTDRLLKYLSSNGHAAYGLTEQHDYGPDDFEEGYLPVVSFLVEAELVLTDKDSPNPDQSTDPLSFFTPSDFLIGELHRCLTQDQSPGYEILPFQGAGHRASIYQKGRSEIRRLRQRRNGRFLHSIDVLWLSPTEFITQQSIYGGPLPSQLHSYTMGICEHESKQPTYTFRVFSLLQFDQSGLPTAEAYPELPFSFLRRVISKSSYWYPMLEVECGARPQVDIALSLVPTMNQSLENSITICFANPSVDLVQELSSHPVHQSVLVQLEAGMGRLVGCQATYDDMMVHRNPDLFDWSLPRHASTTLTMTASGSTHLSCKSVKSIGSVEGLLHLTLDYGDWGRCDSSGTTSCPAWVAAIWRSDSNLASLAIAARSRCNEHESLHLGNQQEKFEQLSHDLKLPLDTYHSLSRFHWDSQGIKSNDLWDSRFSPSLVLNSLRRQPGRRLLGVSGIVMKRVNQGVFYSQATNLVPCDLSASSASAIFDILHSSCLKDRTLFG
jgi:hypothetical protein